VAQRFIAAITGLFSAQALAAEVKALSKKFSASCSNRAVKSLK